jgi:Protein of Unknown function (DUF2784)
MGFRVLVVMVAATHISFVAYVVFGGFLTLRWPRAIAPHAAAVGWGFAGILVPLLCPLTVAENWARQRAGEPVIRDGFINHYLTGVLYPDHMLLQVRILAGCVMLASWLIAYRRVYARPPHHDRPTMTAPP